MFIEIAAARAAHIQHQWPSPFYDDPVSFWSDTPLPSWERRVNQPSEFSMTEESRSIHSHALPNYERAEIARSKIEGYALDPANDEGRHKARVFKSALGFDQSNWELLKQSILGELPYHEAQQKGQPSRWGSSYVVDLPIEGPNGQTVSVRTVWLFKAAADFPSLITLYVLPKSK